ncbi:hypothetical protein [Arthrobacter sp. NPDC058192]|uniref:hypothetical protein n=1 Tax=Arthrobacter sp. NPDC058192 TaxID=3346372 RepID=UPI0036E554C5
MESCPECRGRQQRERQYLERLRGAAVPEASDDLTARLLARTEQLAAEPQDSQRPGPQPAGPQPIGTARPDTPAADAERGGRHGSLSPALAAGGAVAALALMAGTAYLMGGDAGVPADGTEAAALSRPEIAGPLVQAQPGEEGASNPRVAAGSGTRIGFGLVGEPDFIPAGALSAGQLAAFRSQGWACPELQELGFHLVWARAGALSGDEVLELHLTDGRHFATVLEQHAPGQHAPGTPLAPGGVPERPADTSPINILTGHTAVADGFTPGRSGASPAVPDARNGALWLNAAPPFRAIYQTAGATFTYISDLPAEQAGGAVTALARAGDATPVSAHRGGIAERMERGLSRILASLAP